MRIFYADGRRGGVKNRFHKLAVSLQHFGVRMMISKAWEKYVIDTYRFRAGLKRELPFFPLRDIAGTEEVPQALAEGQAKKRMICYLLHYFYPDKQGVF